MATVHHQEKGDCKDDLEDDPTQILEIPTIDEEDAEGLRAHEVAVEHVKPQHVVADLLTAYLTHDADEEQRRDQDDCRADREQAFEKTPHRMSDAIVGNGNEKSKDNQEIAEIGERNRWHNFGIFRM